MVLQVNQGQHAFHNGCGIGAWDDRGLHGSEHCWPCAANQHVRCGVCRNNGCWQVACGDVVVVSDDAGIDGGFPGSGAIVHGRQGAASCDAGQFTHRGFSVFLGDQWDSAWQCVDGAGETDFQLSGGAECGGTRQRHSQHRVLGVFVHQVGAGWAMECFEFGAGPLVSMPKAVDHRWDVAASPECAR